MLESNLNKPIYNAEVQVAAARKPLASRLPSIGGDGGSLAPTPLFIEGTSAFSPSPAPLVHLWIVLAYFFVAFSAQAVLLIPQFAPFRVPLRILPFAFSLGLAFLPLSQRPTWLRMHPATTLGLISVCIVAFGLLNQYTDSLLAGSAQIALTMAILSPLLWVGRLRMGVSGFAMIVLCLWAFNSLSAGVGVLQVVFPGHFQPGTSTVVQEQEEQGITHNIELADGTETSRPYGLTDQPGGAATAGLSAFVFGLGLLFSSKKMLIRALYLVGMGVGLFIIYLSQVRAYLIMSGVATVVFIALLVIRGEGAGLVGALLSLAAVILLSTAAAFAIGGSQTRDRIFTLSDDSVGEVYYANRGRFLDYTFNSVLPTYPLGAGLGRYGMMSHYFAQNSGVLWAEIQWTAWAYDGGWLLIIAYPITLLIALWASFTIGRDRKYGTLGLWAAILTSYNISVVTMSFSYAFFESQSGLEFWLLNAALFSASQVYLRSSKQAVPAGFEVIPTPWRPAVASDTGSPMVPARRRPLSHRRLPGVVPTFDASGPNGGST